MEATLGEIDMDIDGAILLYTLWDVKLCKVLVAAIGVLSTGPVTIDQVMLLPEERRGGIEVCEVLVL